MAAVRKAGLCGPELTSIIGLLKGACHASLGTIRKYLQDVYDLKLSRGFLAKVIAKVSDAVAPLYDGLLEQLKIECVLNIDETGRNSASTVAHHQNQLRVLSGSVVIFRIHRNRLWLHGRNLRAHAAASHPACSPSAVRIELIA